MGTLNNPGPHDCLRKAEANEPLFHLLGRDPFGWSLVHLWAIVREGYAPIKHTDPAKLMEAHRVAKDMEIWCTAVIGRECADVMHWIPTAMLEAELHRRADYGTRVIAQTRRAWSGVERRATISDPPSSSPSQPSEPQTPLPAPSAS